MSAAESLRELKERREFDTPTDRSTYRQGQLAESAILAALPEIIAVIAAAELNPRYVYVEAPSGRVRWPLIEALEALDTKLVEAEQGRLDDSRRVAD